MIAIAAGGETILRDAPVNGSRVSLDYPINSRLRRGNINIMTS